MNKKSNSELISSLLYILIGALLVIFRDRALGWAMTVAGVLFLVFAVLELLRNHWSGGAVNLIIGIAIIVFGWALTGIVILVLGILIALKGVVALVDSLRAHRKSVVDIVFSILTVVIGLLLAFGNLLGTMIVVAGVMLMIDGLFGLVGSLVKK